MQCAQLLRKVIANYSNCYEMCLSSTVTILEYWSMIYVLTL